MSQEFLKDHAERMLRLLGFGPPLTKWEIRALDPNGGSAQAGVFGDLGACVEEVERTCGRLNIFVGLQPRPELGALPVDDLIRPRRRMTRDDDIVRVENLAIDMDAVRESGMPATEGELALVRERAMQVSSYLMRLGLPRPIEVLTGNGIQLILPLVGIDLVDRSLRRGVVVSIMRAFEAKVRGQFQDDRVRIDRILNLGRIIRLAGTLNVKGNPSSERPWRMSRVLWAPKERIEISIERIGQIAGKFSEPRRDGKAQSSPNNQSNSTFRPANRKSSTTRECCGPIRKLWEEGFPRDRSKAIWNMSLYFGFLGESKASTIGALLDYNERVVKKPQVNLQYLNFWVERAISSSPMVPCKSLGKMGYCSGVAHCNWGEHSLEIPDRPVVGLGSGSQFSKICFQKGDPMWNPKEIAESLEIEPGVYRGRIVDAFDGNSQTSGAEMTTVVVEIEDKVGTRIFEHLVKNHPVHRRRTMALLGALGMLNRKKVECKDLIGKNLKVRISVEKFEGLPQARIKKFMPADETGEK